jgi:hypothetical protein
MKNDFQPGKYQVSHEEINRDKYEKAQEEPKYNTQIV